MVSRRKAVEWGDTAEGTTLLVRHLDETLGASEVWTERSMFGWRQGIMELDQIRSLSMMKLNAELNRVASFNAPFSANVRARLQIGMLRVNRDVDAFVSRKVLIAGNDSMDQIVVDATVRRLHYHIDLTRIALDLLGSDPVETTHPARALLYLTKIHVTRARDPIVLPPKVPSFSTMPTTKTTRTTTKKYRRSQKNKCLPPNGGGTTRKRQRRALATATAA